MIHTFSVTVETDDDVATLERLMTNVHADIEWDWPTISIKVAPITGIQRQHLIGELDND
jgi:hypothetical protein